MKKIFLKAAAILLSTLMLSTSALAAKNWTDAVTVEAGKGKATIDGKFSAAEWASAKKIAITLDDATVKQYGVYQGAWEKERKASDFDSSMYFMWDEEALYICEVRKDDNVDLSGTGKTPWGGGDGNLIFIQTIDGGAEGNKDAWSHHVLYIVGDGTASGKYGADTWVRINNGAAGTQDTKQFAEIKSASAAIDGGFCVEVKVPWSVFAEKIPSFKPAAGAKIGMSMVPIDFDNGGDFAQLCWVNQAEKLGVARGYDYGGWATLTLAAPAKAPATTDAASLALAALAASLAAGFAVVKTKKH